MDEIRSGLLSDDMEDNDDMDLIEIEKHITEVDARSKSNSHRLDEVENNQKAVNDLALSVRAMATEQQNMKEDLGEVKTDVKELASKSGKRWDNFIDKVVWAIAAACLAFILAQIGL